MISDGILFTVRLLTLEELERKVSIGKSTIYRMMDAGTFPRPLAIGGRTVRWREAAIDAWIATLRTCEKAERPVA